MAHVPRVRLGSGARIHGASAHRQMHLKQRKVLPNFRTRSATPLAANATIRARFGSTGPLPEVQPCRMLGRVVQRRTRESISQICPTVGIDIGQPSPRICVAPSNEIRFDYGLVRSVGHDHRCIRKFAQVIPRSSTERRSRASHWMRLAPGVQYRRSQSAWQNSPQPA